MLVVEVLAVISGAIFGTLLARRKGMDFVGVFSVAFMTSFGGGTLRDVLLDRHPLFWIQYSWYPAIVFAVAACVSLIRRVPEWVERFLNLPDALGLGLFSIVGTQIALNEQVDPFIAVLFGVITGCFGGVIGDIACNDVPNLFRAGTPLYATCAFAGSALLVALTWLRIPESIAFSAGASTVVGLRLLALRFRIGLKALSMRP
jgi:uncharacterized membrane protein YeiH